MVIRMKEPLISVIVPIYNVEEYIYQCIDSILNQTYKNLEIILVDDGSPCRCPEICDEYALKDRRITVIHQPNRGVSAARNCALDIARGDYIAFVDGDDWLERNAYQSMMEFMLNHDLDVVFCTANIISDHEISETRFEYFENETIMEPQKIVELTLTDDIGGQVWMKLWHKKCWENVRFPVGRIYEDLAISFVPFTQADRKIGFLKKPLYNYRMNMQGISFSRNTKRAYHIFLAFSEHYEYAKEYCETVKETCLIKAMNTAVSAYNRQIIGEDDKNDHWAMHIKKWLKSNKKQIMGCDGVKLSKKASVRILLCMEPVYRWMYILYNSLLRRNR